MTFLAFFSLLLLFTILRPIPLVNRRSISSKSFDQDYRFGLKYDCREKSAALCHWCCCTTLVYHRSGGTEDGDRNSIWYRRRLWVDFACCPPNGYRSRCGRPIYVSPSVRLLIRRGIEGRTPYLLPNAVAWQNRRWGNVCVTCDSIPLSLCWDSGWNRKLQSIGINRGKAGRCCTLTG